MCPQVNELGGSLCVGFLDLVKIPDQDPVAQEVSAKFWF